MCAVFYQNSSIKNLESWTHSPGAETGFLDQKPKLSGPRWRQESHFLGLCASTNNLKPPNRQSKMLYSSLTWAPHKSCGRNPLSVGRGATGAVRVNFPGPIRCFNSNATCRERNILARGAARTGLP